MKYTGMFVLAFALFLLLACSAADVADREKFGPEYYEGRTMGEAYARKDAPRIKCTGIKPKPSNWSRKHNPELEEQGRSDMFKNGFYGGYSKEFKRNWDMRCD